MLRRILVACCVVVAWTSVALAQIAAQASGPTAIRAGRLIDPETGTLTENQVILVQGERITAVGSNIQIPVKVVPIQLGEAP